MASFQVSCDTNQCALTTGFDNGDKAILVFSPSDTGVVADAFRGLCNQFSSNANIDSSVTTFSCDLDASNDAVRDMYAKIKDDNAILGGGSFADYFASKV